MKRTIKTLLIVICCFVSCNIIANITEIDCKKAVVPARFIPQPIKNYLKANYPGQAVKKIEINKNEYEIELANGLDLTFNKHFKLIDID